MIRRPAYLAVAVAIVALVVLTGVVVWFALPAVYEGGVVSSIGPMWVRPATATPRDTATPRPTSTPAPWARTATAKAMPSSTPGAPTSAPVTATARLTAIPTPTLGIGRPPQRCATEFTIVGSSAFAFSVWDNLSRIHDVAPEDYDMAMACTADGTRTKVRRIVDATQLYSDYTGTVWMRNGIGALMASSLLHEGLHITRYGWNVSKSTDCTPENRTLFHQADWLDKAAAQETDPGQAEALRTLAKWYRDQKDKWNCPAP